MIAMSQMLDFGTALVDASNEFNKIKCYLMLWNTQHCWNAVSCPKLSTATIITTSSMFAPGRSGTARCFWWIPICVGLMPLAEQMREEMTAVLQTWFADNMAGAG
ncbi:hypothetical protein ACHAXR_006984 [Thalassiosira sp. AJA248-18]